MMFLEIVAVTMVMTFHMWTFKKFHIHRMPQLVAYRSWLPISYANWGKGDTFVSHAKIWLILVTPKAMVWVFSNQGMLCKSLVS